MGCTKILTPGERPDIAQDMSLRDARLGDLTSLVSLDRLCFGHSAWSARAWWETLSTPEWVTAVLSHRDQIIAASVLLPIHPTASLASLAVHPGHRRKGLARYLLHVAIDRARQAGAPWLSLEVDQANLGARRLYRGEGFGVLRRFREEGRWRMEMVRRLGGACVL